MTHLAAAHVGSRFGLLAGEVDALAHAAARVRHDAQASFEDLQRAYMCQKSHDGDCHNQFFPQQKP